MAIKNRLSAKVKSRIKGRAATKYSGKSATRQRAKLAASKGKTLAQMGGKKTGYSGKGVVKKADLASGAKDLTKTMSGAKLAKAQKARTLARQAAKQRHAAAVKRGRKAGKK